MSKLFKLTTQDNKTYNNTVWGPGVTHKTSGEGEMCGPGWLHAYTSPELAVFLNPIHANIASPKLWVCEGTVQKTDRGLKVGTTQLTTLREIQLPEVSTLQRIGFAIYCAQQVYSSSKFDKWADEYLSGRDRSAASAADAAWDAAARAWDAAARAADAAARAAWDAAARAAWAAAARAASCSKTEFLQQCAEWALLITE